MQAGTESRAEFQTVEIGQLEESKTNPRKHFAKDALSDLTESIREKGILVPLLVRPRHDADTTPERYEILAGARRYRAAKAAKLTHVPVLIRELDDAQALEVTVIENLQREDVHPLEEAEGYKQLLQAGKYEIEGLAAKVGKSVSYVYQRLKLAELTPAGKKAFLEDKITAGHAILIARLQPDQQKEALDHCNDRWNKPSVRDLGDWIQRNVHLDLAKAPWQKDDEKLLPKAGACTTCPKRTGNAPGLFPDVKKGDTCTDPGCFHEKLRALIDIKLEQDATAQLISTEEGYSGNDAKQLKKDFPNVLMSREYRQAGNKKCKSTRNGLMVDGAGAGTFARVCTNLKCKTHKDPYAYTRPVSRPRSKAEIAREEREKAKRLVNAAVTCTAVRQITAKKVQLEVEDLREIARYLYETADFYAEDGVMPAAQPKFQKLSESEAKQLILTMLLAPATQPYARKDELAYLDATAKRYKVNLAAIRKEVEANAKKAAEEAAEKVQTPAKPAKKAKAKK